MQTFKQTQISAPTARELYRKMIEIRKFEDKVHELVEQGEIPGLVHLYAGQEAVAVGVCAHLTDADIILGTHRSHSHCIAKGCDLDGMMAELYGKATGLCRGKGGSMHITDFKKGMLGSSAIVGGNIPLACGAGLVAKLKNVRTVSACFLGDGASHEGTFHEAINLAAIWHLPILFVVENNGFGASTAFSYASSSNRIADRAAAYNIVSYSIDGTDIHSVYQVAGEAVARARNSEGPFLLDCQTYRHYGHLEGDCQKYKTAADIELHKNELDTIRRFRTFLLKEDVFSEDDFIQIDAEAEARVVHAVEFARNSQYPSVDELFTDVYASV